MSVEKKHIPKKLILLSMDSTIGEFRKKFREDKEFQQHCKLLRNRNKNNVDFVMALLFGCIETDQDQKIYRNIQAV